MSEAGAASVFVTGAGRGIGRAIALAFARRGLDVGLVGRTTDDLERTAHEVTSLGTRALSIECDVASADAVAAAKARFEEAFGVPSVVVNNAGVVRRAPIEGTSEAHWDHVLDVNLKGPFLVTRAFLPAMRGARRGRFVHLGSISSTLGTPNLGAYCASKWGLVGFHRALVEELRGTGLQTVVILPGSVDTEMLAGSGFPPRMTPEAVAGVVVYAALDAPDAVHGSAIEVFG